MRADLVHGKESKYTNKGHLNTHLRLKAHVKHPVCLIQHHVSDPTQVGNATYTHQGRRAGRKWLIQEKPASTL